MAQTIKKYLNDSFAARWAALILIALAMFFAYMFVDVMSPLQSLIESSRGWDSSVFGSYAASEYMLNVFGFLIIAGIILDKMGVRFTGILSTGLMVIGAAIKYVAITEWFQGSDFCQWLNSWWVAMPGSAKLASLGFMIFGCGCEMAGITVSKAIAKWFEGKEMALAMGLEMAIARLGVFAVLSASPRLAEAFGGVEAPILFCVVLLLIGLINFIVFSVMDAKLDRQKGITAGGDSSEEFKVSDLKKIFGSKMFWLIALLCVLYYSAIFPFQRCYNAYARCHHHDRMPPQLRIPPPYLPKQGSCSCTYRCAWSVILIGTSCSLAICSKDHRPSDPRKCLLAHLLDPEHRTLPCTSSYRSCTQQHRRLHRPYVYLRIVRSSCIHHVILPQYRRQEEGIRT